jgi:hypothetical protein
LGTFHHDTHPLHGITCVVDTTGPRVYVGRVDSADARGVHLLDVDVFDEKPGGETKAQFVERTARVGPWKRLDRVTVSHADVASVRRLGDEPTA